MTLRNYIIIAALGSVLAVRAQEEPAAPVFRPPFDFPLILSGNFGELRSNHFHGGVDFKTQGEVFAAPNHMGNAHEMIVNDNGKIIGGQAVPLHQHLVVQGAIFHGDVAENGIMEGGDALRRNALTDDIGLPGGCPALRLLQRQVTAGVRRPVKVAGVLLGLGLFAEAVVRAAFFHQQTGILSVGIPPLGLDIRGHRAAHIGALVMGQAALGHGAVDHVHRAVHIAALVRVLNAQDEIPAMRPGDQPGIQRRPQVTHVHIARGGRGKPGPDPPVGDFGLHLLEIGLIQRHAFFLPNLDN